MATNRASRSKLTAEDGSIHTSSARCFTLIELLVVVAIIALLIAILLPSLKSAREQARVAVCSSNEHQLSVGFHTYATDNVGFLPVYSYGFSAYDFAYPPFWHHVIVPYMGGESGDSFGFIGPDADDDFMPCPSRQRPGAIGTVWPVAVGHQSYGTSYPTIFAFYSPPERVPFASLPAFDGSARLDKVPPGVYMVADGRCYYPGGRTEIHNPMAHNAWAINYDFDGDGQIDSSYLETFTGVGPHNGLFPIHNGTANYLFADGAVLRISVAEWGRRGFERDESFFGVGLPDDLRKYK